MAARKKLSRKLAKRRASARGAAKGNSLSAGLWFEKLVALQKRLRARNGCPWDRSEEHTSELQSH